MELHETEIVNSCSPSQPSSGKLVNEHSSLPRTNAPKDDERMFRQTNEETNKRTSRSEGPLNLADQADPESSEPRVRVSNEARQEILQRAYGTGALNENGYLRKRSE